MRWNKSSAWTCPNGRPLPPSRFFVLFRSWMLTPVEPAAVQIDPKVKWDPGSWKRPDMIAQPFPGNPCAVAAAAPTVAVGTLQSTTCCLLDGLCESKVLSCVVTGAVDTLAAAALDRVGPPKLQNIRIVLEGLLHSPLSSQSCQNSSGPMTRSSKQLHAYCCVLARVRLWSLGWPCSSFAHRKQHIVTGASRGIRDMAALAAAPSCQLYSCSAGAGAVHNSSTEEGDKPIPDPTNLFITSTISDHVAIVSTVKTWAQRHYRSR